jgi:hypothetical protein
MIHFCTNFEKVFREFIIFALDCKMKKIILIDKADKFSNFFFKVHLRVMMIEAPKDIIK